MSETNMLSCQICNVPLHSVNDKKLHFGGKKHKRNEELLISMQNTTDRTIHVSGLPNGILEMQLQNYFNQFGPISKTILDKQNGYYAFVEFANRESQQNCFRVKNHVLNGKKVRVAEKRQRAFQPTKSPTNDLNGKFNQFENNHLNICQQLQNFHSVKDQFLKISWIVTLSSEEVKQRISFVKMIEQSVQHFFPGCEVCVYGSSASGYGFKGCDMDLTILIPERQPRVDKAPMACVPSVNDIQEGRIDKSDLLNLPNELMLQFLKRVVKKIPHCIRLMVIPSARCPILRFLNPNLGISCDMCFNKRIGIQNTKLLKHYGRLDVRVRPLLLTLRYWAKIKDLLGSGHRFTSYSFTWLVLFYLQKCEPPVVPPVETLQNLADEKYIIDGYNVEFCEDFSLAPKSQNKEDIVTLFKGFFTFYFNFDFTINAICPKTGKIVDRNELKEEFVLHKDFKLTPLTLQDPFELDRNITSNVTANSVVHFLEMIEDALQICQSPDFHNFDDLTKPCGVNLLFPFYEPNPNRLKRKIDNVEQDMDFSIPFTDKMMDAFRAQELLEDCSSDQVAHKLMQKICFTIQNIFQEGLIIECAIIENHLEPDVKKEPNNQTEVEKEPNNQTEVEKELNNQTGVKKEPNNQTGVKKEPDQTDILDEKPIKKLKVDNGEGNVKRDSQCRLVMKLHCAAYYRTWNGRRKKRIDGSTFNSPLQCENGLSLALIKDQKLEKPDKPLFEFEVHLFYQKKGVVHLMRISLVPVMENREFTNCVAMFLVGYIPKIVESCLTYSSPA